MAGLVEKIRAMHLAAAFTCPRFRGEVGAPLRAG
jgi:hypothetical protein